MHTSESKVAARELRLKCPLLFFSHCANARKTLGYHDVQLASGVILVQDEHGQIDEVADLLGQCSCKTMNISANMQRTCAGTYNNRTLTPRMQQSLKSSFVSFKPSVVSAERVKPLFPDRSTLQPFENWHTTALPDGAARSSVLHAAARCALRAARCGMAELDAARSPRSRSATSRSTTSRTSPRSPRTSVLGCSLNVARTFLNVTLDYQKIRARTYATAQQQRPWLVVVEQPPFFSRRARSTPRAEPNRRRRRGSSSRCILSSPAVFRRPWHDRRYRVY